MAEGATKQTTAKQTAEQTETKQAAEQGATNRATEQEKTGRGKLPTTVPVKIGGRMIPLRFRMNQFIQAEKEIGNLADIKDKIESGSDRGENLVKMIRIMGNAGLKAAGEEPDLTDEWLAEEMIPGYLKAYQLAVLIALSYETKMESIDNEENEERDLVLEEINKKKEPTNTHTDTSSAGD